MTDWPRPRANLPVVALVATGLLTVVLSFAEWGTCPSTPCGGFLLAFSEYSGIDLGFGVVTAAAGVGLLAIGLDGLRRRQAPRVATIAVLFALLVVATAGAAIIWMHVLPGPDGNEGFHVPLGGAFLIAKDFRWPPYAAVVVGCAGLVALATSLSMRRALLRRPLRVDRWPPDAWATTAYANRALLGAIGPSIVGIAVAYRPKSVVIWAYHVGDIPSEELESLDDALGEMAADSPVHVTASLNLYRATSMRLRSPGGVWVYLRMGYVGEVLHPDDDGPDTVESPTHDRPAS